MPNSPLRWTSKSDMQKLRKVITAFNDWESAALSGSMSLLPQMYDIIDVDHGLYWGRVRNRLAGRAWGRFRNHPDWDAMRAAYSEAHMKVYDRRAYELNKLRQEVAGYRAEVAALLQEREHTDGN